MTIGGFGPQLLWLKRTCPLSSSDRSVRSSASRKVEASCGGSYIQLIIVDCRGKRPRPTPSTLRDNRSCARLFAGSKQKNSNGTRMWSEMMGESTTTETTVSLCAMTTSSLCSVWCVQNCPIPQPSTTKRLTIRVNYHF